MAYYPYPYQYTPQPIRPLPPPDVNWVDHVQENRTYLKTIQKSRICKRFEGLKDAMLFAMEVSTDSVEMMKAKSDTICDNLKDDKNVKLYVKFLDFLFLEVDGKGDQSDKPKESPSYSDFFQNMLSPAKPNLLSESSSKTGSEKEKEKEKEVEMGDKVPETKTENKKTREKTSTSKNNAHKKIKGKKESKGSKGKGGSKDSDKDKEAKLDNELKEPKQTTKNETINGEKDDTPSSEGKAALFVMKGEALIRSLQEHSIIVKVTRSDEKTEDTKTEGHSSSAQVEKKPEEVVLGTTAFRVPESFRVAVLSFIDKNTSLPCSEKHSDTYELKDTKGEEVGKVNVAVTLTCFGKMVENCIQEAEDEEEEKYTYDHTKCWRTIPKEKCKIPKMNPKLALHLLKTTAKITPRNWKSEEILRHFIRWGVVKVDDEERRHALIRNDCVWHRLAKQAKCEMDSTFEVNEFIRPLKTAVKQKMKGPPTTYKSVIKLTTTVVSSTIIASRSCLNKKPDCSTTWISKTVVCSIPKPIDVEKIKEATENEDLKDLWIKQRIINKAFREEQKERKSRKRSDYECLEKLRSEVGEVRSSKAKPPKESIKSSLVSVKT